MPKVSVIIPNYNHAQYLPLRIESVLNQTFQDFELILMDDCSTDNSQEIIQKYAQHDKRIRVILNETNSGSTFKQWNKGIREAICTYIWLAESDDYAEASLLEQLVFLLENHSNVGIAYCQSNNVNQSNEVLGTWVNQMDDLTGIGVDVFLWKNDFVKKGSYLVANYMIAKNIIPNASAALFRRKLYEQVGYADESFRLNGDWLMWVKMLLISDLAYIAQPLNSFRTHTYNLRTTVRKEGIALEEWSKIIYYIGQHVKVNKKTLDYTLYWFVQQWAEAISNGDIPPKRSVIIFKNLYPIGTKLWQYLIRFAILKMISKFRFTLGALRKSFKIYIQ